MPVPTQVLLDETLDRLSDDPVAKERLRLILAHERGEIHAEDACARLGISKTRFYQVRREMLAAALDSVALGRPGRPRKQRPSQGEEVEDLRHRVRELELENELLALRARLEEVEENDAAPVVATPSRGGSPSQPESRKSSKKAGRQRRRQQRRTRQRNR